jgi:SAM-dependent methyltransferase
VTTFLADPAQAAYDELAFAYDELTAGYCHERWLEVLEDLALAHGLAGRRLLDIACGTGKSFLPLLRRGYSVTACDLSEAMALRAAAKAPEAEVFVADMRALGRIGDFDLVTCLDDALNYVLTEDDLIAALEGVRRNLAPAGVALWDVNTLKMYRSAFASDWIAERDGMFIAWHGRAGPELDPGDIAEASVDVFAADGEAWMRSHSVHRQRHWAVGLVCDLAAAAGLRIVAVRGQHRGAVLDGEPDEGVHTKVVFVATRDDAPRRAEEVIA